MKTQKNNQETDIQSSAVTTGQKKYLRHQKLQKLYIFWSRILIFIAFLMLWQISADFGWIDSFYFSSPTAISQLFWHDIADRSLLIHIGITLLEAYEPAPRNTLVLFDRFGQRKLVYAKVHTCDFDTERNLTPGEDFYTATLDTACGGVNVGAMICYDREFPESARIFSEIRRLFCGRFPLRRGRGHGMIVSSNPRRPRRFMGGTE